MDDIKVKARIIYDNIMKSYSVDYSKSYIQQLQVRRKSDAIMERTSFENIVWNRCSPSKELANAVMDIADQELQNTRSNVKLKKKPIKYIEIDTSTEMGKQYAHALYASPILNGRHLRIAEDSLEYRGIIKMPLDTLQLCPYLAMKYSIRVKAISQFVSIRCAGILNTLSTLRGGIQYFQFETSTFPFSPEDIKLNLTPILKNKVDGVRIVEETQNDQN